MEKKSYHCCAMTLIVIAFLCIISLSGCGSPVAKYEPSDIMNTPIPEDICGYIHESSVPLRFAKGFTIDHYTDPAGGEDLALIRIDSVGQYAVIPDDVDMEDITGRGRRDRALEGISFIKRPHNIYIAASQVMDYFGSMEKTGDIKFSSMKQEDWWVSEAVEAMSSGAMVYAGKYSAPDYELLLEGECDLAIENTMIYHKPEVKEKLESFGIPVLVDRSSYETDPFGRAEWIKLYGALMGAEAEAELAFERGYDEYARIQKELDQREGERPTVAFFYISAAGDVKVRKGGDYMPRMIDMAGGSYAFSDLPGDDGANSTMTLSLEEFYARAKDSDYILYNSTIEGEIPDIQAFLAINSILKDLKAVSDGKVFCLYDNTFQSVMDTGSIIADIYKMLNGQEAMTYIYRLE